MAIQIGFDRISGTLCVSNKEEMIEIIEKGAPSLIEGQLKNMAEIYGTNEYLSPTNIQETIRVCDTIDILIDYNNEYYIVDNTPTSEEFETLPLW